MKVPSYQKQLEIEGDNYNQTVLALCAFANEILFDDASRGPVALGSVHCGRKFRTSPANRHSQETNVRPDLAVVRAPAYRVIAEAKFGFSSDANQFAARFQQMVVQIEKYDDDLAGWPAPIAKYGNVPPHDLVLLVNIEDAKRVTRELKSRRDNGTLVVNRSLAVISIVREHRANGEWPMLILEDGGLSDAAKTLKLEDRIPIRPELIASNPHIGSVAMYDHPPPLPIMMFAVHKAIVRNLTPDEQEQYNLERHVDKPVSMAELRKWLSAYAFKRTDTRDADIPELDWIVKAIAQLDKMGWIERAPGSKEGFVYHHKKGRKGASRPYHRFVEVCAKELAKADEIAKRKRERKAARSRKERERYKRTHPLLADLIEDEATENEHE